MQSQETSDKFRPLILSDAAGLVTAVVGLLVLIGWQFDIGLFKTFLPGTVTMKANTAASFLLAGLAIILMRRSTPLGNALVRFSALVIALVGILTLCQYLFAWNLGIDQIIFREPGALIATSNPGRMAPNTALNCVLLGYTLFVLTFHRVRSVFLVGFPIVFSFSIALIGFLGYVTGLEELAGPAAYTRMAVHTAFTFILLCSGIFFIAYKRLGALILIEHKIFAGLTVAAAVILFISFLSVTSFRSLLESHKFVEHMNEVKSQLNELLNRVMLVQARGRSYVLTGDEKYADELMDATGTLPGLLKDLRVLTIDDPRWKDRVVTLDGLVIGQIEFSEQIYRARKGGETEAVSLLRTGRGTVLIDNIRAHITQMIGEEDRLIQKRNEDESKQAERTERIIYLSLVAQLFLLALIFFKVNKDVTGRRKAEESLRQLNEELEDRVRRRTAEVRRAHADLQQSEEKYRSIFENAIVGIYQSTIDGKYISANLTLARIYGYASPEELMGSVTDLSRQFYVQAGRREEFIRLVEEQGPVLGFESQVYRKDGSVIWISETGRGIRDAGGTSIGFEGTTIDITARKRAELASKRAQEALWESESRFRSLIENSHDVISLVSADGTLLYDSPSITRVMATLPMSALGAKCSSSSIPMTVRHLWSVSVDSSSSRAQSQPLKAASGTRMARGARLKVFGPTC